MQMCDVIITNKTESIPLIFMIRQKQKYLPKFEQNYLVVQSKKSLDGCYKETYVLIITINSTS